MILEDIGGLFASGSCDVNDHQVPEICLISFEVIRQSMILHWSRSFGGGSDMIIPPSTFMVSLEVSESGNV